MNQKEFEKFNVQTLNVLGQEVNPSFQVMPNGESRTRITGNGNVNPFSYIRVEMPEAVGGGWQNAHYHNHTIEIWIIEKGCQIVIEEKEDGGYKYIVMEPGDTYSSKIGVKHNCYVSPGAITHTVKTTVGNHNFDGDWIAADVLDKYSKSIDMEEFIRNRGLDKYF